MIVEHLGLSGGDVMLRLLCRVVVVKEANVQRRPRDVVCSGMVLPTESPF